MNKKEHLYGLDFMRYALGMFIVLYHTFHYDGIPNFISGIVGLGFFGTSSFFILSGFILSYVYFKYNEQNNSYFLKDKNSIFLLKRFANLYPIHILSLLFTLIVVSTLGELKILPSDSLSSIRYVMYDSNNYTPIEKLHHFMSNGELFLAFIMNTFLLQSWNPYYLTFNAPAWSISTLFFMYITFPYIGPKLLKMKNPLIKLFSLNFIYLLIPVLFILNNWFDMPFTGIINRNPLIRIFEFMAGIILCNYYVNIFRYKTNKKVWNISFIIVICIALYLASLFLKNPDIITKNGNGSYYLLHTGLLLIPECCLILLCCSINIKNEKIIHWSKRLGGASLPLFALHIPVYLIFNRAEIYLTGEKHLYFYPLYLILITYICIVFQEKIVVSCRNKIMSLKK